MLRTHIGTGIMETCWLHVSAISSSLGWTACGFLLLLMLVLALQGGHVVLEHRSDLLARAEPRICAFDIETTKLPLQFPNAEYDQVGCNPHPTHSCGNDTRSYSINICIMSSFVPGTEALMSIFSKKVTT